MEFTIEIYQRIEDFPDDWNQVVAPTNVLLSKRYMRVLEESKPENMECYAFGFYKGEDLIGGALVQYLHFKDHDVMQKQTMPCSIRNYLTKTFSKDVLILGNNMLTGQNGFYFDMHKIEGKKAATLLLRGIQKLQKQIVKPNMIIFKDYRWETMENFRTPTFKSYYEFSVQPNMILQVRPEWHTFDDYLADFSKKYRARAKSARKKNIGAEKRELDFEFLQTHQEEVYGLYLNVAENASINTFFLTENHFASFKKQMGDQFRVFGYFLDDQLIGFFTLILNGPDIDTYFLGYDSDLQKERQIYLNMLLDMVEFSIDHRFKKVIFGRTALEIKSTIGAEPVQNYGLIKHNNPIINSFMKKIFPSIEPPMLWEQRHPFKTKQAVNA